jgi:hypothetical protein
VENCLSRHDRLISFQFPDDPRINPYPIRQRRTTGPYIQPPIRQLTPQYDGFTQTDARGHFVNQGRGLRNEFRLIESRSNIRKGWRDRAESQGQSGGLDPASMTAGMIVWGARTAIKYPSSPHAEQAKTLKPPPGLWTSLGLSCRGTADATHCSATAIVWPEIGIIRPCGRSLTFEPSLQVSGTSPGQIEGWLFGHCHTGERVQFKKVAWVGDKHSETQQP